MTTQKSSENLSNHDWVGELSSPPFDDVRRATYVALDVPTWTQAEAFVDAFGHAVDGYKVGLELFYGDGAQALAELQRRQKRVFLDVKLHDIPNTVAGALSAIGKIPCVEMVNVHASGGQRMMMAAREALDSSHIRTGHRPKLIAVTILTSLDEQDFEGLGWQDAPSQAVVRLASLTASCGLDGVVASAKEIRMVRDRMDRPFEIVVPGTRPLGADTHDQRRSLTPGDAFAQGATRLVLGRAVTGADNPIVALNQIWTDMKDAKEVKG